MKISWKLNPTATERVYPDFTDIVNWFNDLNPVYNAYETAPALTDFPSQLLPIQMFVIDPVTSEVGFYLPANPTQLNTPSPRYDLRYLYYSDPFDSLFDSAYGCWDNHVPVFVPSPNYNHVLKNNPINPSSCLLSIYQQNSSNIKDTTIPFSYWSFENYPREYYFIGPDNVDFYQVHDLKIEQF